MAELDGAAEAKAVASFDAAAEITALRAAAADRFDPVRFHFIEALARRAEAQQGEPRRLLDERLAAALAAYRQAHQQARDEAGQRVAAVEHPAAAEALQRLLAAGDFAGLRRAISGLEKARPASSIAGLTRYIAQHSPENLDGSLEGDFGSRSELKTIRNFRNTWSKLSVDKQVTQAIEQAPENAGPINSHLLVLRSLALMRDISPDYLNRFMAYADTLLWLDQAEKKSRPAAKKPAATRTAKK